MQDFLELFISACSTGAIYGLVALSYLLMIRPTGIINFAVGEWCMVGAFAAFTALTLVNLPYIVAIAVVVIFMLLIGWFTERVAVRPLVERGAPVLGPILALLGMLVIFREGTSIFFGADQYSVPYPFGFKRIEIGPFGGAPQSFYIIAATIVIFIAAWYFFERTVWGRIFEAVAINRRAAALMGINLRRVQVLAFAFGAAVAGMAGMLISPNTSAHWLMGLPLAIQGFSALIIGGVGRVEGALLGGLILAFVEQLTVRYAPIPSGLSMGVPLLLLIIFLLVRPTGLLKPKEAKQ
ncbi:MAG: branched-chain amino acid ABC transporter permease [Alphaproteobacteria bacterium]